MKTKPIIKRKSIKKYASGGNILKDVGAGITGVIGGALGVIPGVGPILQQGVNSLDTAIQGPLNSEEKSIGGYGNALGAIGADVLTGGATTGNSLGTIASGLGQGVSNGNTNNQLAQGIGTGLNYAGTAANIYGMVSPTGMSALGKSINSNFRPTPTFSEGGQINQQVLKDYMNKNLIYKRGGMVNTISQYPTTTAGGTGMMYEDGGDIVDDDENDNQVHAPELGGYFRKKRK